MPIRIMPVVQPAVRRTVLASAGVILVLAWWWPLPELAHRLFAAHMLQHLVVMNGAALMIAAVTSPKYRPALPVAAGVQLAALWLWHLPGIFVAAKHDFALHVLMQLSLFVAALWFWWAVLDRQSRPVWQRVFALLITAKIFCLLGAALIFARRPLYQGTGLEDQQLAGLLMVGSCALIYVTAAIALFAGWLFSVQTRPGDAIPLR